MATGAKNGEFGPELEGLACFGEVNDGPFRCPEHQRTSGRLDAPEQLPEEANAATAGERCAGCGEPLSGDPADGVGLVMSVDPVLGFAGPMVHYGTGCINKVPGHLKERRDAE